VTRKVNGSSLEKYKVERNFLSPKGRKSCDYPCSSSNWTTRSSFAQK